MKRGQYAPLYVGQTPDLSEPFRNESALPCITEGRATHVHVRFAGEDEAARAAECEDLVASLKPPCNASA